MAKRKIIAIILVILIVVIIVVSLSIFWQKKKADFDGQTFVAEESKEPQELSLFGKISDIDSENHILTIQLAGEKEVKIMISQETRLTKLTPPFSSDDSPLPGTQFIPEETEISFSDFEEGNDIYALSKEGVNGKSELNNIESVKILP